MAQALLIDEVPSTLKDLIQSKGLDEPLLACLRVYFPGQVFPRCSCPLCRVEIRTVPMQVAALTDTIVSLTRSTSIIDDYSKFHYISESGSFENLFQY